MLFFEHCRDVKLSTIPALLFFMIAAPLTDLVVVIGCAWNRPS